MSRLAEAAELDRREALAMQAGDSAALAALYSDRLVVTPPGGPVVDKAAVLGLVDGGVLVYEQVERTAERVVDCGEVIVSAGSEQVVAPGGQPQHRRYTHVWANEAGTWRLVGRHASAL